MAYVGVNINNDGEAVWFVELCKKLGFTKLEIAFGDNNPVCVDFGNGMGEKPTKFENQQKRDSDIQKGKHFFGKKGERFKG